MISDKMSRAQQQGMAQLRGAKRDILRPILLAITVLVVAFLIFSAFTTLRVGNENLDKARRELLNINQPWARNLSAQQKVYRDWIIRHGTGGELAAYDAASQVLFRSATTIGPGGGETPGLFTSGYLSLHFGVMRLCFLLLASLRIWVVTIIAAVLWRRSKHKVHQGDDLLGQLGNGRIFYSGLRVGLEKVSSSGAPDKQAIGLACPAAVSQAEAKTSPLGQLLASWQVANETNLGLVAIILKHANWPAYVADFEEENLLADYFSDTKLVGHTELIVQKALELHRHYYTIKDFEHEPPFFGQGNEDIGDKDGKVTSSAYAAMLQEALHRVLSPHMRLEISQISPAELATIVLSFQAGKVMAYGYGAGKWSRKSNYPHFSARAVLHSIPAYGREFSFEERNTIRRSLVYAARSSAFGPVRMPTDLSDRSRAGRQWVELLMACPHELQAVADEVELVGMMSELHSDWTQKFFDCAMTMSPDVMEGTYATQSNLFFMPLGKVMNLVRRITTPELLRRFEELVQVVSQKQKLQSMSLDAGTDGGQDRGGVPNYTRIFPPLNSAEIKSLAELHQVSAEDLKIWSTFRVMLNFYGWLGRRVGDYTVPESSVIFAILHFDVGAAGANDLGLIGKSEMIPFRGTKLEARWGKSWQSRFVQAYRATMSETREDFDKLMRGINDTDVDDFSGPNSAFG